MTLKPLSFMISHPKRSSFSNRKALHLNELPRPPNIHFPPEWLQVPELYDAGAATRPFKLVFGHLVVWL